METKITFDQANLVVPEGIRELIEVRCDLDGVPYKYAELWIETHYEFYQDSQLRVWVVTDFPEEPGCWVPELSYWVNESEIDEEIEANDE